MLRWPLSELMSFPVLQSCVSLRCSSRRKRDATVRVRVGQGNTESALRGSSRANRRLMEPGFEADRCIHGA